MPVGVVLAKGGAEVIGGAEVPIRVVLAKGGAEVPIRVSLAKGGAEVSIRVSLAKGGAEVPIRLVLAKGGAAVPVRIALRPWSGSNALDTGGGFFGKGSSDESEEAESLDDEGDNSDAFLDSADGSVGGGTSRYRM